MDVKINFRNIKYTLKEINYKHIEATIENLEVKVYDTVIPTNISNVGFDLIFERKLEFVPNKLFNVSLEYLVECLFDDEGIKYFNSNQERIEDFIERSRIGIVNALPIVPQSSLIIAQITGLSNPKPLVLPPTLKDPYKPAQ